MAQTNQTDYTYVASGSPDFLVPFPYLSTSEVEVTVDGAPTGVIWTAAQSIQLTPTPAVGALVRVRRNTDARDVRNDFSAGAPFSPRNINENNEQLLYAVEETVNETAGTAAAALAQANHAVVTADNAASLIDDALQDSALYLRNDLANSTDPTKGAGMVGYSGRNLAEKFKEGVVNVLDYAHLVGPDGLWNAAINAAQDQGRGVYLPASGGPYRVEKFVRTIRPGNTNVGQEQLTLIGDPHTGTTQHQYMVLPTIIEGDGDIFLDVVNYSFKNIGVRNRSAAALGNLFTMYGKGLEGGSFEGCYFGLSNRHFYCGATPPVLDQYIIGPYFYLCAFFHAHIVSRHFDGQLASYTEDRCYTSHCNAGLFSQQPGPGMKVSSCVYEYVNGYAFDVSPYGYSANYSLALEHIFFESCGGGLASIPGMASAPKSKATASIRIAAQAAGAANVLLSLDGCFFTYTNPETMPTAWVYLNTDRVDVVESQCLMGVGSTLPMYSAAEFSVTDPFTLGAKLVKISGGEIGANKVRVGNGPGTSRVHIFTDHPSAAGATDQSLVVQSTVGCDASMALVSAGVGIAFGFDPAGNGSGYAHLLGQSVPSFRFKPGKVQFTPISYTPTLDLAAGDVYYDSRDSKLKCYNGTTWNNLF